MKPAPRPSAVALQHLAAAMAHEVRNPLNSIALHVELLESRLRPLSATERASCQRSLEAVAREVGRIDAVLDRYLEYAGPSYASSRMQPAHEFVAAACARLAELAADHRVRLECRTTSASWPIDADLGAALDAVIANAIEASPTAATVTIDIEQDDGHGRISVEDEGAGIQPQDLPHIFQLGFTTRTNHAGIGLAVAKQIIRGRGGAISVAPAEDNHPGTRVALELPLAE